MAHSRARCEWPEPSTPTMMPDISFSLCREGSPAPLLPTVGTQDPPDKGHPGWAPGTLVLNLGWTYSLELRRHKGPRGPSRASGVTVTSPASGTGAGDEARPPIAVF